MLCNSLGPALRADGIALSHDGVTWFAGSGAYGHGWGEVGKGIRVPAGATFYVKYYSDTSIEPGLYYAPHGTKWGSWQATGPQLAGTVGTSAANPIILKFQNVGTPSSAVTWINGSGSWGGIVFPGNYDLALRHDTVWTLPPVTILPSESRSWWRSLLGSPSEPRTNTGLTSVPDSGGTALLLGVALLAGVAVWFAINHRRFRSPRSSNDTKA